MERKYIFFKHLQQSLGHTQKPSDHVGKHQNIFGLLLLLTKMAGDNQASPWELDCSIHIYIYILIFNVSFLYIYFNFYIIVCMEIKIMQFCIFVYTM